MPHRIIKIAAALAIIFAGFAAVVTRGSGSLQAIFRTAQMHDFMSGALSGKIDRAVFDAIPRSAALNGFVAGLLYRGLRDAGPQVRVGCNDWLFSMEELREERHKPQRIAARARLLRLFAQALAKRDVYLVVVPVPDKVQQAEGELCGIPVDQSQSRANLWSQAAEQADVIDLKKGWPRLGYWRTDTHWNSEGARFAAEATARVINDRLGAGAQRVTLVHGERRERSGDLARLADLTDAPQWLAPAPEYEEPVLAEIARSGSLLDDVPAPAVVLTGSSYSLNSGFIDYLQASLGREVAQLSEAGGGFAGALLKLLEKPDLMSGVKVVIWEWPMRSLASPLSDTERRYLEQAEGHS